MPDPSTHAVPPAPSSATDPRGAPVWEDGAWDGFAPLDGDTSADVCVVGLGGSGLAAVREARALGASVVGIDAGIVAGGAAGRNGGFLLAGGAQFHHDAIALWGRERAVGVYRETLDELTRMAAETPEHVRVVGSLRIADSAEEEDDCRVHLARMQEDGLPALPYEGPEGRGILVPTDAVFQPLARCRELARRAASEGARLHERTPAIEIGPSEVRTPGGRVRCGVVIVAVDGRLERLLPALEGRVRTARLQMVATAPLPEIRFPRAVYRRYGYEWWQQLPDGRIALGGFRDQGGAGEWTDDARPAAPVLPLIERFLREGLGVTEPITHRWAAPVGYTEDGIPVCGEVEPGVWAAGGYSGTGNVVGALCGRALAQLALRGRSDVARAIRGV